MQEFGRAARSPETEGLAVLLAEPGYFDSVKRERAERAERRKRLAEKAPKKVKLERGGEKQALSDNETVPVKREPLRDKTNGPVSKPLLSRTREQPDGEESGEDESEDELAEEAAETPQGEGSAAGNNATAASASLNMATRRVAGQKRKRNTRTRDLICQEEPMDDLINGGDTNERPNC
ncbi:hypothetical protein FRC00_001313 [Tulasnella sp. 408]|nr:hypothetical protein FRC00_001313 [Tulasnella sp. 408]